MSTRMEKGRTFDVSITRTLFSEISRKGEELLCCHSAESPLCAPIFCLTDLALIWTRRGEGAPPPPWRFSVGMTSPRIAFYSSGNSSGAVNASKGPAALTQQLLGHSALHRSLFTDRSGLLLNMGTVTFLLFYLNYE